MKRRVGYIGVGRMGHGAAKNILAKGWAVTVLAHRNRAPVDDLVARGATEAVSAAVLAAGSDVIFLCLPGAAEVEASIDALRPGLRPGTIIVDKSTGDPATTRRLGAVLASEGIGLIDAPIGRSPKEAEEGRLSTVLGGEAAHIAIARPIIAAYADTIIAAGALGNALTVKIINNFVSFANAFVIAETFATASRLGIAFEPLIAMIEAGGSNSTMFQWIKPWITDGDDSRGRGRIAAGAGVFEAYRAAAAAGGAPTVMADAVGSILGEVLASGYGEFSIPHLPGIVASLAGAGFRDLKANG